MKVVLEPDDAPIEVDGRADDHGLEFEQLPEKVWVDAGHFGVFLDEGVYDARRGNYLHSRGLNEPLQNPQIVIVAVRQDQAIDDVHRYLESLQVVREVDRRVDQGSPSIHPQNGTLCHLIVEWS